jgi:S1-C subfamily serine protease
MFFRIKDEHGTESLQTPFLPLLIWLIALITIGCDNKSPELTRLDQNWAATVMINATSGGHATGVVISHCGYILTNDHVAREGGQGLTVMSNDSDGLILDADIVATDSEHDLAILRVRRTLKHTVIIETDDRTLFPGDGCYSIGYPYNMGKLASVGHVRSVDFTSDNPEAPPVARDALLLGQRMEPGTSGSGIFSSRHGRLVGLMSQLLWQGNNIFQMHDSPVVVPARHIRTFLQAHHIPYCRSQSLNQHLRDLLRSSFYQR